MLYENIKEMIGNTPILHLKKIEEAYQCKAHLYAKVESYNPSGSVKDRASLYMLEKALKEGKINKDTIILEQTSGNTGIGLSMLTSMMGLKMMVVMPESMSVERRKLMKAYGATLVLTPAALGMQGTLDKVEELKKEYPNHFVPDQFKNEANVLAHYEMTGPEIYRDLNGKIDLFIAGIGTGGTITGVGRYLKEKNPSIQIFGVEPSSSNLLSGGKAGAHKIQGIGANFIPEILDRNIYDKVCEVSNEDALFFMKELTKKEGVFAGISSGAALSAAIKEAQKEENRDKNIVVLLPDSGDRYLSLLEE